jgi:hypothetical protein
VITDDRDDVEYWDALADRVASAAVRPGPGTMEWLAESRSARLATLLFVSVAAGLIALSAGQVVVDRNAGELTILAPEDRIGQLMTDRDQPPPIGTLLMEPPDERLR